jgi:hypothetical protein
MNYLFIDLHDFLFLIHHLKLLYHHTIFHLINYNQMILSKDFLKELDLQRLHQYL